MTYTTKHVRPGLTAIAAVLALSSTPLLAQETTVPPDPVAESPADPAPVADPLAPEPAVTGSAPAEAAAPAATARRAPARARTTAAARAPAAARARAAAPVATAPVGDLPAEPVPIAPPPAELTVEPAPLPVAPAPVESEWLAEETLPIAAGAGLGLIALAGIGMATRRRRRRVELDHIRANEAYLDQHPAAPEPVAPPPTRNDNGPAFVRAGLPASAPVATASTLPEAEVLKDAPKTKLPSGFDLSRFGPHVRAAYLGPTPDNPSLSLKYRLRRAAAMDQRTRLEAERHPQAEQAEQPTVKAAPAPRPAWVTNDEGFMFRKAGSGQSSKTTATITRH